MKKISETETVIKRILPYLRKRGYVPEVDFTYEEPVKIDNKAGRIDIIVNNGNPAKPVFLIEAKKASRTLTEADRNQALSYGKSVNVFFVVLTNGKEIECINVNNQKLIKWDSKYQAKIPRKDQLSKVIAEFKKDKLVSDISLENDISLPYRPGLPLKQLNELFKRCHNAIRKIEKNEESAFADFSKLLFLKLLEEKSDLGGFDLPYSYQFCELADISDNKSDQVRTAITNMLLEIKRSTNYGDVLSEDLKIKSSKTYHTIVKQLASVSFSDSSLDSKGAAFEYYVRATLKGKKLGQYFTPRPLVELMLAMVGDSKITQSVLAGKQLKVLDPACGTGGFLVYMLTHSIYQIEKSSSRNLTTQAKNVAITKLKQKVFFGSDANDGVASAAKMNMIIAGDGHTNIKHEDSLSISAKNWDSKNPDIDIILTNPPFGTSESESLSDLDRDSYSVDSTKGQLLFLQKMIDCVVPEGEICTVIDEGVLNTASAKLIREYILKKRQVMAVVRLPDETFKPNKINVRSSVLYLKRLEHDNDELALKYDINFIDVKSLGYNGSGDSIRGFDFEALKRSVSQIFESNYIKNDYVGRFTTTSTDICADATLRFDYKYWDPAAVKLIKKLKATKGVKSIKDINTIKTRRGKSPNASDYVDGVDGYSLVIKAGSNISKDGSLIIDGDYLEKNVFDQLTDFHLADGDILLSSTGTGTLGKCCVFRSEVPAIADGHVTVIRVDQDLYYPEFICDYLRCGFGATQIERLYTGSTGLIELAPDEVNSIVINVNIPIKEQKKISEKLRLAEKNYSDTITDAEKCVTQSKDEFKKIAGLINN